MHLTYDQQPITPGMKVYQLDYRNHTVKLWEFQVVELLANNRVKIFHINTSLSPNPMQLTVAANGICADPIILLDTHRKTLMDNLDKIPNTIRDIAEAKQDLDKYTNRTTIVEEFANHSEEI